jgi:histidinol-phosphate/aromatic aminotransferase/cobyric acid decarboxylase-like protein
MKGFHQRSCLPEIECIEMLEDIEAAYAQRFGATPFNVSHWDPSEEFQRDMLPHLDVPPLASAINYSFSYQIAQMRSVLKKLGGNAEVHYGLFTPSCTSSILCVLDWLESRRVRRMIVVCPAYFSLFHAAHRFGIELRQVYMKRQSGEFVLPMHNSRFWRQTGTLWITNPVYGAGTYLSADDVAFLSKLLRDGWTVIVDECLVLPGRELSRTLGAHPNFVGIYSPHKSVCVNGIKFCLALFHSKYCEYFERWCDIWYGGLGCSSLVAITHFLSGNFDSYASAFLEKIASENEFLRDVCVANNVEFDSKAHGHFASCYLRTIPSKIVTTRTFMERLVYGTGGSVITGNRSRFSPLFRPTLTRIIRFLISYTKNMI